MPPIVAATSILPRASRFAGSLHRARQRLGDQANAFQRDPVAQRVKLRRGERLDAVRQRIGAGGGGELRRQIDRQLRVEDDQVRQQRGMEDHALLAVDRDDRAAADFAAGAGGGRDRDETARACRPCVVRLEARSAACRIVLTSRRMIFATSIALPPPRPMTLSQPAVAIRVGGGADVGFGRIGLHVGEDLLPSAERVARTVSNAGVASSPRSVTSSGLLRRRACANRSKFGDGAGAEHDRRREREDRDGGASAMRYTIHRR